MTKRTIWNASKYVIGLALLAYVVWKNWSPPEGSGPGLSEALQQPIQFRPLVLAVSICLPCVLLTFVRWYFLVRAQDLPFTITNAIRLGLVGYFFNSFMPGAIGGDVIKAAFIAREQSRRTVAVATVLIDRAIGMLGLVWVVAILGTCFFIVRDPALLAQKKLQVIVLTAQIGLVASVAMWFVLGFLPEWRAQRFAGRLQKLPKIGKHTAEFWQAAWMYRKRGRAVSIALLLTLVTHVGFVLTFYFAAQVLQDPSVVDTTIPTLPEHFLIVPIGMVIQAFFPTPGGIGGGELGFGGLYALVDRPSRAGEFASLVKRVIEWSLGLVGYLIYLRMRPALRPTLESDAVETAGQLAATGTVTA